MRSMTTRFFEKPEPLGVFFSLETVGIHALCEKRHTRQNCLISLPRTPENIRYCQTLVAAQKLMAVLQFYAEPELYEGASADSFSGAEADRGTKARAAIAIATGAA